MQSNAQVILCLVVLKFVFDSVVAQIFCVYVNTTQEFDGSDSGARPDEAISWVKLKRQRHPLKYEI